LASVLALARRRLGAAATWLGWALRGELAMRRREWRRQRDEAALIAASPLFDADWYRRTYGPIGAQDPARHYVAVGAAEGREPGPGFDGRAYLAAYPDAALEGRSPLLHYLTAGAGRAIVPVGVPPPPLFPPTDEGYRAWLKHYDAGAPARAAPDHVAVAAPGAAVPDTAWTVVCVPEVMLAPGALGLLGAAADDGADVVTADDDRVDADGVRSAPRFKPEWDADLLAATGYAGGGFALRSAVLRGLGVVVPPVQDVLAHLAERVTPARARHVPAVLFHARSEMAWQALDLAPDLPERPPLVSVIIPTKERADLLSRCLDGLLAATDYPAVEVLVIDNGSTERATSLLFRKLAADPRVRVIAHAAPFDWCALNNAGARAARGELLLLLNNDVFVQHPGWLAQMVRHALRPEVGAVGATLLYPDGRLQHAGVVLTPPGLAGHVERFAPGDAPGPFGSFHAVRSVAAVTGACLLMRRAVFEQVGGLAEGHLPVTFNDVDLCLRIRAAGLRVLMTPHARLTHMESVSRGSDDTPERAARRLREWRYMHATWGAALAGDPHLSPNYAMMSERLMLASPPRVAARRGLALHPGLTSAR
jgi:GT2 family glycosyltransferase